MNHIARLIAWIDRNYGDTARSNYAMGVLIAAAGLMALWVDSHVGKALLVTSAAVVLLLFGWRMILYVGRLARGSNRRRRGKR